MVIKPTIRSVFSLSLHNKLASLRLDILLCSHERPNIKPIRVMLVVMTLHGSVHNALALWWTSAHGLLRD